MAKRVSTVAKGDAFENRVFIKLKELLESDMLALSSKHSKIFQQRKYKGKSGNEVTFDIVIESYHADSNECANLTVIECKDYKSTIPVDRIRNFASSIDDVGANKGYFITTSNFQKGVINHAKSSKIGLARFPSSDLELNWVLRRVGYKPYQERSVVIERLHSEALDQSISFAAVCDYDCYSNFIDFVSEQLFEVNNKIDIPYISDDDIQTIMLEKVSPFGYAANSAVSTELLEKIVTEGLGVTITHNTDGKTSDLGCCDFKHRIIRITSKLEYDTPRWRFTLAHEIGHYILHEQLCLAQYYDNISSYGNEAMTEKSLKRMEIQANKFASFLLIPEDRFWTLYIQKHKELEIPKFPHLHLDEQPCNIKDCMAVFSYISNELNVSIEAVKIKLQSKGLLTIKQSTQRVGKIFSLK